MRTSLLRMDGMDIRLSSGGLMHGVDQDWYSGYWQRKAGCGPSTASNMLRYFGPRAAMRQATHSRQDMVDLMHGVWGYVTPGMRGLNSTQMFSQGMDTLLKEQGSALRCHSLDIPASQQGRPDKAQVTRFIREGLAADSPVAFLNLHRGQLMNLENWHWVTLISLEEGPGGQLFAQAIDNGRALRLDMGLWLDSSKLGGGFVYCR